MNIAAGALTHLAYCWLVERADGGGLALTSHDRALTIDGQRYSPSPGIEPRSLRFVEGLDGDDTEIAGNLSSASITGRDLEDGRWDGAKARLFAVDWTQPEGAQIQLFEGQMGSVETGEGGFSATLQGGAALLERPACPSTSPLCRASLGDRQCRVDLAGRTTRHSVAVHDGAEIELETNVSDDVLFGSVRVISGSMRGFRSVILAVEGSTVTMRDLPRQSLETGSEVLLSQGCDRRFATCVGRFGNGRNFRGEPHLPGTDLLTRYPGA